MNKKLIKAKILFKQNSVAFSIIILWFVINYIVALILTGDHLESLAFISYLYTLPGPYGIFYPTISEFVIFGIIISVIVSDFYRKYSPKQTALELARNMSNHVVIIGYSQLGAQIREYLININKKYVVIEPDEEKVEELLAAECPVITRSPNSIKVLKDANVEHADLVITTQNDLETLIVATSHTRDLNKDCRIVCRCYNDSLAEVLTKTYNCKIISTSKYAAHYILTELEKEPVENVLIVGFTNTTKRLIEKFKILNIKYKIIEKNKSTVENVLDNEPIILADAKDKDNLKEAGILNANVAILLVDRADEVLVIADCIKDLKSDCKLICRFYHGDVGEILGKPPFNAIVISQSKHTLDNLIKEGVFDFHKILNLENI
ncbi:MAG: NAD-binding protein [Candidatus Helarchaeota archaeon]